LVGFRTQRIFSRQAIEYLSNFHGISFISCKQCMREQFVARSPHLQLSKHFHSHHPHQQLMQIVAKFSSLFYAATHGGIALTQTDLSPEFGLNMHNIWRYSLRPVLKCKVFWFILSQTILSLIIFIEKGNNILNIK
jgi:hypothetical protein